MTIVAAAAAVDLDVDVIPDEIRHRNSRRCRTMKKRPRRTSSGGRPSPLRRVFSIAPLLLFLSLFLYVRQVGAEECCTLCLWCQSHNNNDDAGPATPEKKRRNGAVSQQPLELFTTFEGGNGQSGVMFDVENTSPTHTALISNLVLHTSATRTVTVEVYTKSGTYEGYERSPDKWDRVASVEVLGNGEGLPTPLPAGAFDEVVEIQPGRSAALYVTLTEYIRREVSLIYTDGRKVGRTVAESDLEDEFDVEGGIEVLEGAAVTYPFGEWWAPRVFNGVIVYDMVNEEEMEETTTTAATAAAATTTTTSTTVKEVDPEEPGSGVGSTTTTASTPSAPTTPSKVATTPSSAPASTASTTAATTTTTSPPSKAVSGDLVLELSPLTTIMESGPLLIFQAACQSFLGELFRYTLPPVGEIECRVRGQGIVTPDGNRRKLPQRMDEFNEAGWANVQLKDETEMLQAEDGAAVVPILRRAQNEDEDEGEDEDEISSALQVHLQLIGQLDSAPINRLSANSASSPNNPNDLVGAPMDEESAEFIDTAVDFFSVVSGQFLSVLEEVAEDAGITYFDGVKKARVVEYGDGFSTGGGTGSGTGVGGGEDAGDYDDDDYISDGSTAINRGNNNGEGGGLSRGLIIFLVVISVNAVAVLVACFVIKSRKKNPEWSRSSHNRPADGEEVKSIPPGSIYHPDHHDHHGGHGKRKNKHKHRHGDTTTTPPLTPHDGIAGGGEDKFNDEEFNLEAGAAAEKLNAAAAKGRAKATETGPPLLVVPGPSEDDHTFTSRLQDFDSVAGCAARERMREQQAAQAAREWRRMSENAEAVGVGVTKAVAVDAYMEDTTTSGGPDFRGSSVVRGGHPRNRVVPQSRMETGVAVDAYVESRTDGGDSVRYKGSSTMTGHDSSLKDGATNDDRFNVSTLGSSTIGGGASTGDSQVNSGSRENSQGGIAADGESGPGTVAAVRMENGNRFLPSHMLLEENQGPSLPTLASGAAPSLAGVTSPQDNKSGILPYLSSPGGATSPGSGAGDSLEPQSPRSLEPQSPGRYGGLARGASVPTLASGAAPSLAIVDASTVSTSPPPPPPSMASPSSGYPSAGASPSTSPPSPPSVPPPPPIEGGYEDYKQEDPSVCGASTAVPSLAHGAGDGHTAVYSMGGSTYRSFKSNGANTNSNSNGAPSLATYGDIASPSREPSLIAARNNAQEVSMLSPQSMTGVDVSAEIDANEFEPPVRTVRTPPKSPRGKKSKSPDKKERKKTQQQSPPLSPPPPPSSPQDSGNGGDEKSAVTTASDWFQRMISDAVGRGGLGAENSTLGGGTVSNMLGANSNSNGFSNGVSNSVSNKDSRSNRASRGGRDKDAKAASGHRVETPVDRRKKRMSAGYGGLVGAKRGGGGKAAGLFRFGRSGGGDKA